MTTEIDNDKIIIDYNLFEWNHYKDFMEYVQCVLMNPFWCANKGLNDLIDELVDHDNNKLLEHSLKTFNEKYSQIQQIHLHNFYFQQVETFYNIFKLFNVHLTNYKNELDKILIKYGTYHEKINEYLIEKNSKESLKFNKEKDKLSNSIAITEYDKINPNLYLIEINIILFKIQTNDNRYARYFKDDSLPPYKYSPLLMYKLISDIFDMKLIKNLKINYDKINENFKNY